MTVILILKFPGLASEAFLQDLKEPKCSILKACYDQKLLSSSQFQLGLNVQKIFICFLDISDRQEQKILGCCFRGSKQFLT